jgi:hypothetical protein
MENCFSFEQRTISWDVLFKFCSDNYWYCHIFGFIGWFFYFFFVSLLFTISTVKSIYDLIVSEIIHRDIPLCNWNNWKKIFHCILPFIQLMQFF